VRKFSFSFIECVICVAIFALSVRSQVEYLDGSSSAFGFQGEFVSSSGESTIGGSLAAGLAGRFNFGLVIFKENPYGDTEFGVRTECLFLKGQGASPAMLGLGFSAGSGGQTTAVSAFAAKRFTSASRVFVQPSISAALATLENSENSTIIGAALAFGFRSRQSKVLCFVSPAAAVQWADAKHGNIYSNSSRGVFGFSTGIIVPIGGTDE
jgi:hypothetical protein